MISHNSNSPISDGSLIQQHIILTTQRHCNKINFTDNKTNTHVAHVICIIIFMHKIYLDF